MNNATAFTWVTTCLSLISIVNLFDLLQGHELDLMWSGFSVEGIQQECLTPSATPLPSFFASLGITASVIASYISNGFISIYHSGLVHHPAPGSNTHMHLLIHAMEKLEVKSMIGLCVLNCCKLKLLLIRATVSWNEFRQENTCRITIWFSSLRLMVSTNWLWR